MQIGERRAGRRARYHREAHRDGDAAERIRTIIQQVYNHAIRKLLVTTNPATPMRGVVKRPPVQNHRHLSEKELGAIRRALDKQGAHATTIVASKLLMLTMAEKTNCCAPSGPSST